MSHPEKKTWSKPELIVLARCKPEEAVLAACKSDWTNPNGPGLVASACVYSCTGGCSALSSS